MLCKFYLFFYLIIFFVYFFQVLKNFLTRSFRIIWQEILVTRQYDRSTCNLVNYSHRLSTLPPPCPRILSIRYPDLKMATLRSSRSQMFFKIGVLKNFAIFIGKISYWMDSLFNKLASGMQLY